MRLGVYVGSFNPVHNGHIGIVNYLLKNNYVDKVLIVPTLNYWDKQDLIDIKHRINMLKLFENEVIIVDKTHNKYVYTTYLFKELEKEYADTLYLIIGADNIINFDKWKDYKELLKYKIIVINRNNIDIDTYINKYNSNNFIIIKDYIPLDISSTDIRNGNDDYLNPRVLKYIKENKLYGRE